jgi:hypothetical protein
MKCGKDREKARKSGKPGYFISYLFSLVLDVFAAIVSLAPTGGEGRREGARVDAEPYRRCSSGAREDGFSADSAVGARRPPHLTLSPDEGRGNAKLYFISGLAGTGVGGLTAAAPPGPVFHDPIRERSFEADVVTGLFGFDPLMLQDLFSFCLELLVESRIPEHVISRRGLWIIVRHAGWSVSAGR